MNFYKHYLGDYLRDTADLSLLEHGAYRLLLDHYYATERPLPAAVEPLYRICGAVRKDEQQAVKAVAERYFPLAEDGLRHSKRADEEIALWQVQAAKNRETGKRGGRPKKTESVTESVSAEITESVTESETEPITESVSKQEPNRNPLQKPEVKPKTLTPPTPPGGGIARFAEFWLAYPPSPRKVAKAACEAKWRSRRLDAVAESILADLRARANDRQFCEFTPAPLTYLNQRRWEDEPANGSLLPLGVRMEA